MEYRLWINGGWADSQDGGRMKIEDPATGADIAEVVDSGRQDVDQAVRAAEAAFYDGRWSRKTPSERSRALLRMADLLESRSQEFARVESQNTGKPYEYVSLGADMHFLIDNLRFFAAAARDVHGSHA
ncbi:MAG TPA: aldehyde dehydrogenase family protein, partial [Anaerolineales bacterium]|nr:aldehyde dehydrogenase family protein [Anaerolineales bacterium]